MAALLPRDTAGREFKEATVSLRNLLLSVEELRIRAELAQSGMPDISASLATLAKMQRYDACKILIAAFEEFAEAQVNFRLAEQRFEYESVVEAGSDPAYLRRGSGG